MADPVEQGVLTVEVAYAKSHEQAVLPLTVPLGTTAKQAVELSGITELFPELFQGELVTGIFGQVCPGTHILKAGDRVEIYRPLLNDPKKARRQRALSK